MSKENNMDPSAILDGLPELSIIEEMLIAPIHISINMIHVSGA